MGVLQVESMARGKDHNSTQNRARQLVWQRLFFLSPFESTKVDSHPNPFVNDAKVNLAARRSLAAWRIRRRSRGGRREHGVEDLALGEVKGRRAKEWVGLRSQRFKMAGRGERGWRRPGEPGWVGSVGNGSVSGCSAMGRGPGQFSLVACGHDGGPTTGWTGTSGHRPEESTRDLWAKDGWMDGCDDWELKMDHSTTTARACV